MLQWTPRRSCRLHPFLSFSLFALVITVSNMMVYFYMQGAVSHNILVSEDTLGPASSVSQRTVSKGMDKVTARAMTNSTVVDVTRALPFSVQIYNIPAALMSSKKLSVNSNTKKLQTSARRTLLRSFSKNVSSTSTIASRPNCGDIKFRTRDKNLKYFKPALSGRNLCLLVETMDAFTAALASTNISYFMYGGTLLGSWRHHGLIPWDDDVDFAVPVDHQQRVYRLLMDLKPNFILDVKQKKRWKMFQKNAHPIKGVSWKYPFLDINFYHKNSTHVWDHDVRSYSMFTYPKEWVFPLKLRPFLGRMLWAPRQSEKFLRLTYNLEQCETAMYSHKAETSIPITKRRSAACTKLHGLLPFVRHTPVKNGCNETLEQNGHILRYYLDRNGC